MAIMQVILTRLMSLDQHFNTGGSSTGSLQVRKPHKTNSSDNYVAESTNCSVVYYLVIDFLPRSWAKSCPRFVALSIHTPSRVLRHGQWRSTWRHTCPVGLDGFRQEHCWPTAASSIGKRRRLNIPRNFTLSTNVVTWFTQKLKLETFVQLETL